jgi:hypothetical protein
LLYPLTFGAVAWLSRLPARLRNSIPVIAFACAHAKQPEVLERLTSTLATVPAVVRWTMRLTCSSEALAAAVDEAIGNEEYVEVKDAIPRKRDPGSWHWGAMVRGLCTKYPGTSAAYWTWQVSREYAAAMIQQINEELPEDAQVTDYEVESNAAFRSVVEHIKDEYPKASAA